MDPLTLETEAEETFAGGLDTPMNAHGKVDAQHRRIHQLRLRGFPAVAHVLRDLGRRQGASTRRGSTCRVRACRTIRPSRRTTRSCTISRCITTWTCCVAPVIAWCSSGATCRARFGVIPRYGTQEQVRWFEFEPGYVLHMVNAWEDGDWITMDGCFQPDPTIRRDPEEGPLASMLAYLRYKGHLRRWRMNLQDGREERAATRRPERRVLPAGYGAVRTAHALFISSARPHRPADPGVRRPREVRPLERLARNVRLSGGLVPERDRVCEKLAWRRRGQRLRRHDRHEHQ